LTYTAHEDDPPQLRCQRITAAARSFSRPFASTNQRSIPAVRCEHAIPSLTGTTGLISSLQVEAKIYCQKA
jgi:hypothetical protein